MVVGLYLAYDDVPMVVLAVVVDVVVIDSHGNDNDMSSLNRCTGTNTAAAAAMVVGDDSSIKHDICDISFRFGSKLPYR